MEVGIPFLKAAPRQFNERDLHSIYEHSRTMKAVVALPILMGPGPVSSMQILLSKLQNTIPW